MWPWGWPWQPLAYCVQRSCLIRLSSRGIDGTSVISTQSNHTVLSAYSMMTWDERHHGPITLTVVPVDSLLSLFVLLNHNEWSGLMRRIKPAAGQQLLKCSRLIPTIIRRCVANKTQHSFDRNAWPPKFSTCGLFACDDTRLSPCNQKLARRPA